MSPHLPHNSLISLNSILAIHLLALLSRPRASKSKSHPPPLRLLGYAGDGGRVIVTDMRYKALVALGCLLLASLIFTALTEAQVYQPALPSFSIDSDKATSSGTNEIAITGDTVTLSFSANETIQTTTVVFTVDGVSAAGPVTVSSLTTYDWSSISLGWYHTVALKSDGTLWAWGSNEYGG